MILEHLFSDGCTGPQCVFSCANEHRSLPKQGFTCCLALDGVDVLASGFEADEKVLRSRYVHVLFSFLDLWNNIAVVGVTPVTHLLMIIYFEFILIA